MHTRINILRMKRCEMNESGKSGKRMTINDVAEELGVSISTVSRAISGKGRIGEVTRRKVLNYIEENGYQPGGGAKSIARARSGNIAIVVPDGRAMAEQSFLSMCMYGANETAQARGYDMFMVTVNEHEVGRLKHLLDSRKVDGVILGNTRRDDAYAKLLQSYQCPFVTIGSMNDDTVVQVDHDNLGACRDLTALLLSRGMRRIAYMGQAGSRLFVNEERYRGYVQAYHDAGLEVDPAIVYMDNMSEVIVSNNTDELVQRRVDCILCQDDNICSGVLQELYNQKIRIPNEIRVAACYNSRILERYPVKVTSLKFDNAEIGRTACDILLDMLEGKSVPQKTMLDYEVLLKESTK